MQSDQYLFRNGPVPPHADQGGAGGYLGNVPPGAFFGEMVLPPGVKPLMPFHGVQVQPSEACPRNFIIFDQTDNRSQIMFHPAIGSQLNYPGFNFGPPVFQNNVVTFDANSKEKEFSSFQKEDSEDINALMSLESEENEDLEEDEVSTARTDADCGSHSPDSCSNYVSHNKHCRLPSLKNSSASGSAFSGRKRQKMRKMVKALRGIIPGAGRMSTVTVLDEAVRYLKSLKVEVKKLGVGKLKGYI